LYEHYSPLFSIKCGHSNFTCDSSTFEERNNITALLTYRCSSGGPGGSRTRLGGIRT
jgi:hypothetical protein